MDKSLAYKKLFELKASGVNVSEHIRELCKSSEVPQSVLEFLADNSNSSLNSLLREKLCYKSLKSENVIEQLKGASSLITHLIIESEKSPSLKESIYENYKVSEILDNINRYFLGVDTVDCTSKILNVIEKECQ